jgi:hypothetical protein
MAKRKSEATVKPEMELAVMANGQIEEFTVGSAGNLLSLELPEYSCLPGYATNSINFKMQPRQAAAAKVLRTILAEAAMRVTGTRANHPKGKVVDTADDVVRWLLDRVADHIETTTGKILISDFDLTFGP